MMQIFKIVSVVAALGLTAACAQQGGYGTPSGGSAGNTGGISKSTGGAVLGGIGGAVAGSAFGSGTGRLVGVGVGALLGSLLGSEIGKSLDRADQAAISQSTNRALESQPSGQPVTWRNPDSGNYGTITPQPAVQAPNGELCREFTQTINVGGKSEQGYGRACRQPDGSWKIVS